MIVNDIDLDTFKSCFSCEFKIRNKDYLKVVENVGFIRKEDKLQIYMY